MKQKRIGLLVIAGYALLQIVACSKDNSASDNNIAGKDYLRFAKPTLHVSNKQAARGAVAIESDGAWQLSLQQPVPDWIQLNKMAGTGNDSLVVLATKENSTGQYKFANVIARPVNNATALPVRLTIVQYDSSYKGK